MFPDLHIITQINSRQNFFLKVYLQIFCLQSTAGRALSLDKKQNGETHTPFTMLSAEQLIINIYSTQRWCVANKEMWSHALVLAVVPSRGLKKNISLTFQRYVILDAQRQ